MADNTETEDSNAADETPAPATPPRRHPGHRNTDVRDTVAEMAARAQEISQEAGSKVAMAMKEVINAAAGIAGFAVESVRDVLQYMVRRGQMTQEEADRVLREAEEAAAKNRPAGYVAAPPAPRNPEPAAQEVVAPMPVAIEPKKAAPEKPAPEKKVAAPAKPSAKAPSRVPASKRAAKPAKATAKPAAKGAAQKKASAPPARAKGSSSAASKGKSGPGKKK